MRELNVRWIREKTEEMKRERVREIKERARLVKEDRRGGIRTWSGEELKEMIGGKEENL